MSSAIQSVDAGGLHLDSYRPLLAMDGQQSPVGLSLIDRPTHLPRAHSDTVSGSSHERT